MHAWEMCLRIAGDTQKSLHRKRTRGGLRGWVEIRVGEGSGVRCVCRERKGGQNNVGNKARAVYNAWGNRARRDSLVRIARIASQERICVGGLKPHHIYTPKTPDTAIQRFGVSISWCARERTSETERQRETERDKDDTDDTDTRHIRRQ